MPLKKSLQTQLAEHNDEFRAMMTEFQQTMRDTMRTTMETAVRTLAQAQRDAAPVLQRGEARALEEEEEEDIIEENPFAHLGDIQNRDVGQQGLIEAPRVENRRWESGFKLDLPEFKGGLQPEEFVDWLNTTEELLAFKEVPDAMRVPLVATRLRGRASNWWQHTKEARVRAGKDRITSWEKMKKLMRRAFLPYNYARTVYTKLQNLRQGTKSVDEYATEFFSLLARTPLTETEDQLVSRFIGGLRLQIQNARLQFNPISVSEAHQRALLIEQSSRSQLSSWNPSRVRGASVESSNVTSSTPSKLADNVDVTNPLGQQRTSALKCFKCGEVGHRQSNCPNLNKQGLFSKEDPVYDDYDDDEEENTEEETEQVSGDTGTMLMLRRNHLLPRGVEESWLRTNIFQSTCTIRGKVCRMIIDSGSCTNVISQEAVTKLALFTESHPTPYRLAWLNSSTDSRVSKRCRVPFSMGANYKDLI